MNVLKTALLVLLVSISAAALAAQGVARKAEGKAEAKEAEKSKETKEKTAEVTEAAKKGLQKIAGEATLTSVKAEGKNFKAEWTVDGKENEAIVDTEGNLVRSEIKLTLKDLPEAVRTAVTAKFGEDTFVEFTKITIAKGDKTFYEAESETKGDAMYNTLGVEVDDDEADEDEDDDDDDDDEGEEDEDDDDDDDEEGDDD